MISINIPYIINGSEGIAKIILNELYVEHFIYLFDNNLAEPFLIPQRYCQRAFSPNVWPWINWTPVKDILTRMRTSGSECTGCGRVSGQLRWPDRTGREQWSNIVHQSVYLLLLFSSIHVYKPFTYDLIRFVNKIYI